MKFYSLLLLVFPLFTTHTYAQKLVPKEKQGKWGLFYGKTKMVDFIYDEITDEGYAFCVKSGNKIGLVNVVGKTIIPCEYETIIRWKKGYYVVSKQGKYGLFSTKFGGKNNLALIFDEIKWNDENRKIMEVTYEGRQGLIDPNYNIIFSGKGQSGLMKADGKILIPLEYNSVKYKNEKSYILEKENGFGVFNSHKGKENIKYYEELDWCRARDLNYKVKLNGKYGLIDENGMTLLPFEYDTIVCGAGLGTYYLSQNRKYAYVDTRVSTSKLEFIYDEIDHIERKEGTGVVKLNGKWVALKNWEVDPEAERIVFHSPETRAYFIDCPIVTSPDSKEVNCADKKMLEFIYRNIKYPDIARENGIEGMVVIFFEISPVGKPHNIKIIRDLGGSCGKAAKNVVEKMPDWIPAVQDGEKVWMRFNLPVRFMLAN